MYQLYSYGQKYKIANNGVSPKLALIYPATATFSTNKAITDFVFDKIEDGLRIKAIPFDLSDKNTYKEQILSILKQ